MTHVSGVKSGQNYLVEVTVEVDPSKTLREAVQFEERIREVLASPEGRAKVRGIKRVKIRFVEVGTGVGPSEFLGAGTEDELGEEVKENRHSYSHDDHEHCHEDKKAL